MAGQLVKTDLQLLTIAGSIVACQNAIGDGLLGSLFLGDLPAGLCRNRSRSLMVVRNDLGAVDQIGTPLHQLYHMRSSFE